MSQTLAMLFHLKRKRCFVNFTKNLSMAIHTMSLYSSFQSPQELWNIPSFRPCGNQCPQGVPRERLSSSPGACWWEPHLWRLLQCIYKSKFKVWNNRSTLTYDTTDCIIWVWLCKSKSRGRWLGIYVESILCPGLLGGDDAVLCCIFICGYVESLCCIVPIVFSE